MKSRFQTNLVGEFVNDKDFVLTECLTYDSHLLNRTLFIPAGFKTDFASVPRLPLIYAIFGDKAHHESVVHDYLYRMLPHICTREQADDVFLEAMKVRGKNWFIRRSMYLGVRMGGSKSWR